ncbi:RNA polymerase sigma factor, sigma-70 family [Plantibacter flavus]|uniref:RNA polymerase sigma factor (Sigma-70 family) n=1 Tax=Plantibacter flavus TaxID=150123 RepID=A0A3N2C0J9_9MICO|nr:sigma-70 family RNA polymerase sigma factor [Plantibacter flavus]ROR81035.1 RNA polymerase sigma factor (sigma-70 family) [Plantibacter flavus]SMG07199.1 RNA polymerase sigma factor, sigma-70 family [Plantibacter flavus]
MSLDTSPASPLTERSDAELIEHTRTGSQDAYAELWRRHSNAGRTVARSVTSSLDPDDLVSESFARIYQAVRRGKGPTGAFRPYLFTTIRNTAAAWGRSRRETSLDTLDSFEDPDTNEASSIDALDRSLSARAFRSLPTRWQEVLWYTEIEAMTPAEVAPLLGMKANSVSALAYRAREGLREAWIQAHLRSVDDDSEHAFTISRLGSYARGNLSARDTAKVESHLDACQRCTIVAAEAKEVGSRMALVLLPLVAGAAGAAGYTAWLQTNGPSATVVAAMPAGVTGGVALTAHLSASVAAGGGVAASGVAGSSGAASGAGVASGAGLAGAATAGLSGGIIAAIGVGVVAAVTAGALVLGPMVFSPGADAPTSDTAAGSTDPSAAPSPSAAPIAGPTPTPPSPAPSPSPSPNEDGAPDPVVVSPQVPTPTAPPVAPPVAPADPVDPTEPTALPAPTMVADSGGGYLWPTFSGTGAAGATIDVLDGDVVVASTVVPGAAQRSSVAAAPETGTWSTGPVVLDRTGTFALTVRQTLGDQVAVSAEPASMTITGPAITGFQTILSLQVFEPDAPIVITGAPNGAVGYTLDGGDEQRVVLDADGRATLTGAAVAVGFHELSVWSIDPSDPSRVGPATSVEYLSLTGLLSTQAAVDPVTAPLPEAVLDTAAEAVPAPAPVQAVVDPIAEQTPAEAAPATETDAPSPTEPALTTETETPVETAPDVTTPTDGADASPAPTTDEPAVP